MKKLKNFWFTAFLIILMSFSVIQPPSFVGGVTQVEAATIKLSKTKVSLTVGKRVKLKVTRSQANVKWSSSNKRVATVSSSGVVTGKNVGTSEIYAKVGKRTLKCRVTVKKASPVLSVNTTSLNINESGQVIITFKAKGTISYHIGDINIVSCKWEDGWDGNKATLNIYGKQSGDTTVKITNNYNNESITIRVNVDLDPQSLVLNSHNETMQINETINLTANIEPAYAANQKIEWESSDSKIAYVYNGEVTARNFGTAIITARTRDGRFKDTCMITVINPYSVIVPSTPIVINNYDWKGRVSKTCRITNVRVNVKDGGGFDIYLDGEKTFDATSSSVSSPCRVGYKFYKNGAVVQSGYMYTSDTYVGEKFVDAHVGGWGYLSSPGEYKLELLDVR